MPVEDVDVVDAKTGGTGGERDGFLGEEPHCESTVMIEVGFRGARVELARGWSTG